MAGSGDDPRQLYVSGRLASLKNRRIKATVLAVCVRMRIEFVWIFFYHLSYRFSLSLIQT